MKYLDIFFTLILTRNKKCSADSSYKQFSIEIFMLWLIKPDIGVGYDSGFITSFKRPVTIAVYNEGWGRASQVDKR